MRLAPTTRRNVLIFLMGFAGVLSLLPMLPQQLALQAGTPPFPVAVLQLLAALQSGALVAGATWLGAVCAGRVGLAAPVLDAWARREPVWPPLARQLPAGLLGGAVGAGAMVAVEAIYLPALPAQFLAVAESVTPPWYTRLLYGGLSEEIMLRWGALSFMAWFGFLLLDRGRAAPSRRAFGFAIVVTALLFGLGHLPAAFAIAGELTGALTAYILLGNGVFGLIAGYLFWRRGLECAMLAHITAHVVILGLQAMNAFSS